MTRLLRKTAACVLALGAILPADSDVAAARDCSRPRPGEAGRTGEQTDPVIQQALTFLGQAVNPVRVAAREQIREMYARWRDGGLPPSGVNAFRAPQQLGDPYIYVNSSAAVYQKALRTCSTVALLKLAATLAHEQVHNTDGEFAAYRLQSDFVRSRLSSVPWTQREEARRYLHALDARVTALTRAEQLARATRRDRSPAGH